MRLWTIQPAAVWDRLQASGILRADPALADPHFTAAYAWMVEQMRQRLPRPSFPAETPLWAWYWYQGWRKPRPDLRHKYHLKPGQRGVRIEFELDDSLVLLSDFELWHYVLNYWYLGASEADAEAFDTRLEAHGISQYKLKPLPDAMLDQELRHSWQRIFNLEWTDPYFTYDPDEKSVQATIWELPLAAVRRVDAFVAR